MTLARFKSAGLAHASKAAIAAMLRDRDRRVAIARMVAERVKRGFELAADEIERTRRAPKQTEEG